MTIAIFEPYVRDQQESAFIAVLMRFLTWRGFNLASLNCTGLFSRCGRKDQDTRDPVSTCISCMRAQSARAVWAKAKAINLSSFMSVEENQIISHTVTGSPTGRPFRAVLPGVDLNQQRDSYSVLRPLANNQALGEEFIDFVRVAAAGVRLFRERVFDALLIPDSPDLYIQAIRGAALRASVPIFLIRWNSIKRIMEIDGHGEARLLYSQLVFDQFETLRPEVETWPEDIHNKLREIESHLGLTQQQLSLPMA